MTRWTERSTDPVLAAVFSGKLKRVRAAIRDGHVVDQNEGGLTPLNLAVMRGELNFVEVLVAAGASVSQPKRGAPLSLSVATQSSAEVVSWLLAHGADPCAHDAHLSSYPLVEFAGIAESRLELLVHVAHDLNVRAGTGRTALAEAVINGSASHVQLLLEAGAAVKSAFDRALLSEEATRAGRPELAARLRSIELAT